MDSILTLMPASTLAIACAAALAAGIVKGLVGFGMPMMMISLMAIVLPPDLALAGLILPTLVTNGMQALRGGAGAAWRAIVRFRVYLGVGCVFLLGSAQLVTILSQRTLFGIIGMAMIGFAALQLSGWKPRLPARLWPLEAGVAAVAGFSGGLSGVWGPPTVAYLTAIDTPKAESVRVQGVIYGLGALALVGAHVQTGVLRVETASFSAALIVPAFAGMLIGQRVQDAVDQATFRRATLMVLVLAGANLIRRATMG